jgi:2-dehydro-3-deoxy-D-arabinonate dehydratase
VSANAPPAGIFRVRLTDGSHRLAVGSTTDGPSALLSADVSLDDLLARSASLADAVATTGEAVPATAQIVAPVESQEVWAAGVTYLRSREARAEEAADRTPYDHVYEAERPELFHKAPGWRCVGPGEPVGIRADSTWNVPEPELALVLDAGMRIAGYTIGNDMSSRSIEGDTTLYLPQAKSYDRSCALGPCIVPADHAGGRFSIRLEIERSDEVVFAEDTSTDRMKRSFDELAAWLGVAMGFPHGAFLLTGTGIVPEATFSLQPGDEIRITVPRLGTLNNPVVEVGRPAV